MAVSMQTVDDDLDMLMCPTQLSDDEAAGMQDDEQWEAEDDSWEEHIPDKENSPASVSCHTSLCQPIGILAPTQCFNDLPAGPALAAGDGVQHRDARAFHSSSHCQGTMEHVQQCGCNCNTHTPTHLQTILQPPILEIIDNAIEISRPTLRQQMNPWQQHRSGYGLETQQVIPSQLPYSQLQHYHILQPAQPENACQQQAREQHVDFEQLDTAQLQHDHCCVSPHKSQQLNGSGPAFKMQAASYAKDCRNNQQVHMQCQQQPSQEDAICSWNHRVRNSNAYTHTAIPDDPPCAHSTGKLLSLSCSVAGWLSGLHLQHYLPCFTEHEVDRLAVPLMRDEDLLAIGILSPHDRQLMLTSASQLCIADTLHPDIQALLASLATLSPTQTGKLADQAMTGNINRAGAHIAQRIPCGKGVSMQEPQPQQRWSATTTPNTARLQQQKQQQQQPLPLMQHNSKNSNNNNSLSIQEPAPLHPMFKPQVVNNAHRITSFFTSCPQQLGHLDNQISEEASNSPEKWSAGKSLHAQLGSKASKRGSSPLKAWNHQASCLSDDQQDRPGKKGKVSASADNKVVSMPGSALHPTCRSVGSSSVGQQRLAGLPTWHTLPGTRFTVDYFGPGSARVSGSNGVWILTHFHADHYKGLSRKFAFGTVLCSPITAKLVETRLKLPVNKLKAIPLHEPHTIDGVTLTFVDANHCPGAAMVIAEVPGKPPVLHTGDCRLSLEVRQQPAVQALRGKGAVLVLDTTYCDPQYCFPTQQETLDYTMKAVKSELFNSRALFVFGTYTIGKERLFLEVAHALGKKVYMSKDKIQVLQCCNLATSYLQLLTTNHLETNFHAVPLQKVNLQGLQEILANYKGRYNTIIGFQPTGWAMQRQASKTSCGRRVQKGTVVLHSVPYSEHSSFREMHQFCEWLQPSRIIPSVGNDGSGAARDKMLNLLKQPLPKPTNTGNPLITKFFGKAQPAAV